MNRSYASQTDAYKNWRTQVFRRDHFQCQMPGCGKKGKIHAHHIKRWADVPTLRYAVTNGITLCMDCHKKVKDCEQHYEAQFLSIVAGKSEDAIDVLVAKYAARKKSGEGR
jgi:5-methylcytosine-specific restriction endonuclease McrA